MYEFGNVMLRRLRVSPERTGRALDALQTVVGEPIPYSRQWSTTATNLGGEHRLSLYDTCWAAAAQQLGVPLVSADRQLLDAGLAESATDAASRLGLLQ